jgi:orotate phosphoribosyltransferase
MSTPDNNLIESLRRIGAIQFGHFEQPNQSGVFAPLAINLQLVPSYPAILRDLANELPPLVKLDGISHLLAAPSVVPLATAVSLASGLPLVYPATGNPNTIEGAFDFNEPTVLLTDVLSDGEAECSLIKYVAGQGLDVNAVVAVIDLGISALPADVEVRIWQHIRDILPQVATPSMQVVVQNWLTSLIK